ncbi:MAG TPA: phosphodiester glycosidase family protein [Capsulimonadaceae bacterium]|jgi:hypothetical protein
MNFKNRVLAAILAIAFSSSAIITSHSVFADKPSHRKATAAAKKEHQRHEAALAAKHHKAALAKKQAAAKNAQHAKHVAASKKKAASARKLTPKQQHEARLHAQRLAKRQAAAAKAAKPKKLTAAQKAHAIRLAAKLKHEQRADALAAKKRTHSKAYREHLARLAKIEKIQKAHKAKVARLTHQKVTAKATRIAAGARADHYSAMAAHNERLALHQAALAHAAEARKQREQRLRAAHDARLAAHNARLAAHYARAAQQEAWRREQQARIDLAAANGVVQWGTYAEGVPVQVILVDLNKSNIKVTGLLAENGIGSSEAFGRMIQRSHPAVAVTGTFFSLDNLRPVGDIVIDGNLTYFGGMGTALAITPANKADMITVKWGRHHDWSGYDFVVACGPRLLKDGSVWLDPHAERFRDSNMLGPNSRIAVGITPGNKLIFAMTRDRIYLGKLARMMKNLGCNEAMNLDAGTSTGFYCNGQMIARPGRKLTNAIIVNTDARRDAAASRSIQTPHERGGDGG